MSNFVTRFPRTSGVVFRLMNSLGFVGSPSLKGKDHLPKETWENVGPLLEALMPFHQLLLIALPIFCPKTSMHRKRGTGKAGLLMQSPLWCERLQFLSIPYDRYGYSFNALHNQVKKL